MRWTRLGSVERAAKTELEKVQRLTFYSNRKFWLFSGKGPKTVFCKTFEGIVRFWRGIACSAWREVGYRMNLGTGFGDERLTRYRRHTDQTLCGRGPQVRESAFSGAELQKSRSDSQVRGFGVRGRLCGSGQSMSLLGRVSGAHGSTAAPRI